MTIMRKSGRQYQLRQELQKTWGLLRRRQEQRPEVAMRSEKFTYTPLSLVGMGE